MGIIIRGRTPHDALEATLGQGAAEQQGAKKDASDNEKADDAEEEYARVDDWLEARRLGQRLTAGRGWFEGTLAGQRNRAWRRDWTWLWRGAWRRATDAWRGRTAVGWLIGAAYATPGHVYNTIYGV